MWMENRWRYNVLAALFGFVGVIIFFQTIRLFCDKVDRHPLVDNPFRKKETDLSLE